MQLKIAKPMDLVLIQEIKNNITLANLDAISDARCD